MWQFLNQNHCTCKTLRPFCTINSELLGALMHMRPLFTVVFPSERVVIAGALVLFCFCSGFWKECVSNTVEPCQRPLDDASSRTTTPRCLTSFTNGLSSLFGALLVWHPAGHVHQSAEMSRFFYYKMWESQNLQIWAALQSLRAEQCHGRAYVKWVIPVQKKKNRCPPGALRVNNNDIICVHCSFSQLLNNPCTPK